MSQTPKYFNVNTVYLYSSHKVEFLLAAFTNRGNRYLMDSPMLLLSTYGTLKKAARGYGGLLGAKVTH
jgi:hypothetical protein